MERRIRGKSRESAYSRRRLHRVGRVSQSALESEITCANCCRRNRAAFNSHLAESKRPLWEFKAAFRKRNKGQAFEERRKNRRPAMVPVRARPKIARATLTGSG